MTDLLISCWSNRRLSEKMMSLARRRPACLAGRPVVTETICEPMTTQVHQQWLGRELVDKARAVGGVGRVG